MSFVGLLVKLMRSGILTRLAAFTVRSPKLVLGAVVVLLGVSIVIGGGVSDKLAVGGYNAPSSESTHAAEVMDQNFGTTANLVIQLLPREGTIDDPQSLDVAGQVTDQIKAEPDAKVTRSFTDKSATDLRSRDGRSGLILVHVSGTADEAADTAKELIAGLPDNPNVEVRAGGTLGVQQEIRAKVKNDIKISESIALPVSLAVLVIVFGGLIAAFLPIAVGITSIVTTLLVLVLMTTVTEVSTHALTVATAFGLGLSIDFGLLMVSRFREERASGKDHQAAIIATVATAGRTIIFSAATVTLAMMSLLVFPTYFLRSVGIAASATVVLSALSAIVVLPAMLAMLGTRIDSLAIIKRKTPPSADSMFWRRFAEKVIQKPLTYALPVVVVLIALGVPFLKVQFTNPDERALPTDSNARQVAESLQRDYPLDPSQAITLVTQNDAASLDALAAEVSGMDDVVLVDGSIGRFERGARVAPAPPGEANGAAYALAYLAVDADSEIAEHLVHDIRAKITDKRVEVGGPTATLLDSRHAIAERLPWAIGLIAVFTFILLFLFTGSVVVPMKALLLNLLVLSGVLGVMVWIFQDGHLSSLLGFTPAPLNLSMVVLLCAIAFSLSVDYEIFLLSRIKEARDSGMSNNEAIVVGLGRVGRIVTSAALLLTITLVSFANGMSFMKMFGIGTALAVVIDATIIRGVVVPAFLRVAGELNWWAPKPLRWLHSRIGISEALSFAVDEVTSEVPHRTADALPAELLRTLAVKRAELAGRVQVVSGQHLVANVNGTVIVVANRSSLSQQAMAAQQMSHLVEIVRRTEPEMLAYAFSQLTRSTTWSRDLAEVGVVIPTAKGLEIFLCGGVTVTLDNGTSVTQIEGRNRCLHRSVQVPGVAAVVSVDELGKRPAVAPPHRNDAYALADGVVHGRGAVVWSTDAAPAPAPAGPAPVATPFSGPSSSPLSTKPTQEFSVPTQWVVLDDNSRLRIDRDCVIGRDPHGSSAAREGLRPLRIDDSSGLMSRAHMEIRIVDGELVVLDRNSTNGVLMREPGQQIWTRLVPWQPVVFRAGASVRVGGRTLHVESADERTRRLTPVYAPAISA
ncbi:MMPL family transporter [Mycobacterium barrassiae]|uniref:MMPL family transporter n=1 Tax=Mycobacterium barrassiae TaxID=319709 RepID=UPI002265D567|nr:MMPL family transporter [Mycobacterium barrassiae]